MGGGGAARGRGRCCCCWRGRTHCCSGRSEVTCAVCLLPEPAVQSVAQLASLRVVPVDLILRGESLMDRVISDVGGLES